MCARTHTRWKKICETSPQLINDSKNQKAENIGNNPTHIVWPGKNSCLTFCKDDASLFPSPALCHSHIPTWEGKGAGSYQKISILQDCHNIPGWTASCFILWSETLTDLSHSPFKMIAFLVQPGTSNQSDISLLLPGLVKYWQEYRALLCSAWLITITSTSHCCHEAVDKLEERHWSWWNLSSVCHLDLQNTEVGRGCYKHLHSLHMHSQPDVPWTSLLSNRNISV